MKYQDVAAELYSHIEENLVNRLLKYYQTMKTSQLKSDWEKTGLNAGKFLETAMVISLRYAGAEPKGGIRFEQAYKELLNHPKKNDSDKIFTLLIPNVARSAYTLRNKRGVAHSSDIDPTFMDASCMSSSCDWILSELLRVHHKSDDGQIEEMIASLIKRRVPAVQQIDQETLILRTDLSARLEILAILNHHCPEKVSESKLHNDIKFHSRNNINASLRYLEKSRMVHRKDGNVILTEKGILFVDSEKFQKRLMLEEY
jgi:hypothetical protein